MHRSHHASVEGLARPRSVGVLVLLLGSAWGCPTPIPPDSPRVFHVTPHGDDTARGTRGDPWATPGHAARMLGPGDRVVFHQGTYRLEAPMAPRRSGTVDAWIEYAVADGESVVFDASAVVVPPSSDSPPFPHDQGTVQIEGVGFIRVRGLTLRNSHQAGFTVRDSHHIVLRDNVTQSTFASGIAVWDTEHDDRGTESIEIIDNTVIGANTARMLPAGMDEPPEPPHEAISIGGAVHFEVAKNHVHHCDKEGIDIKETSKHGRVHDNHVHHVARQGLYVDSWFGDLMDVELDHNVVHHCGGAGIVLSVENGRSVHDVQVHHNTVYDNLGTGLFFSRWGDGPRHHIEVDHNIIVHNGHGPPEPGEAYYWLTGGIYLYSANLREIEIHDNIVSDNQAFQIGVSEHYLVDGHELEDALERRGIRIARNWVDPVDDPATQIRVGWPPEDYAWVHPIRGSEAIGGAPPFIDAAAGDFRLWSSSQIRSSPTPAPSLGSPERQR